jgi:hypothetical protein
MEKAGACDLPLSFRSGWSLGAFRQGNSLAEGQKSKDVKHQLHSTTPLRPPREMAEGGLAPEENANF